ncbi:MAG: RibD family protein [Myxococcota bacterium]
MTLQHELRNELDAADAFRLVVGVTRWVQADRGAGARTGFAFDARGEIVSVPAERALLCIEPGQSFSLRARASAAADQVLRLYLPLCLRPNAASLTIAHLGQSLDGRIATESGASRYITGQENLLHLHRLRALCDIIVIGARTAECDDPELTTRLVPGRNAVRVVLDPQLRVSPQRRLFNDGLAPTWIVCAAGCARQRTYPAGVEIIEVPGSSAGLSPNAVLNALRARGKRWIFIEGGGVTISRFLSQGALDRLHLTVAPLLVGAGVPGLCLPALSDLTRALRPRTQRFELGEDVLFDCELVPGERFGTHPGSE